MIKSWQTIRSKPAGDFRIFSIRSDEKISPRTGQKHDFYVIDCVNWVNVIPVTPEGNLVMIDQYRHGSNSVELEIPGGMMDPGDSTPEITAARELKEETGYEGKNPRIIGSIFPNPAIMSNTCHTVLIEGCELKHKVNWDSSEDLLTRIIPSEEIPKLVREGKIRHSLVVVALYHYELWRREQAAGAL